MPKVRVSFMAIFYLATAVGVRAQWMPAQAGARFSGQISNSSAGNCGCFGLEGGAGDVYWNLAGLLPSIHGASIGIAVDSGVDHTGDVNGADYGLTLTTLTAGPRFILPRIVKFHSFAQALFGFAHGSGSQFPKGNRLVSSANSSAIDLGAGADFELNNLLSVRVLQLDYLRTALPNNSSNWQNNLRIGVGVTFHIGSKRHA